MAIIKGEVGDCLSSTILDSGASIVLVNDKSLFTDFREIRYTVGTANDPDALTIEGGGTVSFKLFDQEDPDEPTILTLGNVAYAPDARFNIISVSYLAERAHLRGEWSVHGMTIVDKDRNHLTTAKLYDGLYYIQLVDQEPIQSNPGKEEVMTVLPGVVPPFVVAEIDFSEPVMMWHRKLGHLSLGNLRKLVKMSHGINLTDEQIKAKLEVDCPVCGTTKHTNRIPRDPATRRSTQAGKVMHVDTWGPYPVQSWDKAWYVMTFTDDAKRFTWEDRFQFKSQIPDIFLKRHRRIEKELGTTIDTYRFDNEFWQHSEIKAYFVKHGITAEPTVPYDHHMNGVAERTNRTEREKASAMMHDANIGPKILRILDAKTQEQLRETSISEELALEAFSHAVWLKNRSPTRALRNNKTSWEEIKGYKPNFSHEHIFGNRVWVGIPPEHRRKTLMEDRAWFGYFVGWETEAVMKVWDPERRKVFRVSKARVPDGQGLNDPQGNDSIRDRIGISDFPSDDDVALPSSPSDDSESELDDHDSQSLSQSVSAEDTNIAERRTSIESTESERARHEAASEMCQDSVILDDDASSWGDGAGMLVEGHPPLRRTKLPRKHNVCMVKKKAFNWQINDRQQIFTDLYTATLPSAEHLLQICKDHPAFADEDGLDIGTVQGKLKRLGLFTSSKTGIDWKINDREQVLIDFDSANPSKVPLKELYDYCKAHPAFTDLQEPMTSGQIRHKRDDLRKKKLIPPNKTFRFDWKKDDREQILINFSSTTPTPDSRQMLQLCQNHPAFADSQITTHLISDKMSNLRAAKKMHRVLNERWERQDEVKLAILCKIAHDDLQFKAKTRRRVLKSGMQRLGLPSRRLTQGHVNGGFLKSKHFRTRQEQGMDTPEWIQKNWPGVYDDEIIKNIQDLVTGMIDEFDQPKCNFCRWKGVGVDVQCIRTEEGNCERCIRSGHKMCRTEQDDGTILTIPCNGFEETLNFFPPPDDGNPDSCLECRLHDEYLAKNRAELGFEESMTTSCIGFPCDHCINRNRVGTRNKVLCHKASSDGKGYFTSNSKALLGRKRDTTLTKHQKTMTDDSDATESDAYDDQVDDDLSSLSADSDDESSSSRSPKNFKDDDSSFPANDTLSSGFVNVVTGDFVDRGQLSTAQAVSGATGWRFWTPPFPPRKDRRAQEKSQRKFECLLANDFNKHGPEPRNRREALRLPDAKLWEESMKSEYNSLLENDTWEIVPRPTDRKVLGSRWVFKRKLGPKGTVAKRKSRFVVKGYSQVYGLDFDETYASTVKAPSYRLLFAAQAKYGWKCHQMDIVTAFLNGDVEHDIYIELPEGFPAPDGMCAKLNRSLYGLKQSSRLWYLRLRVFLESIGWKACNNDQSVFMHPDGMYMTVYVDDLLIFGPDESKIAAVKAQLSQEFKMTDLGRCAYYLGIHVQQRTNGDVHLHQSNYLQQIAEKFDLQDSTSLSTPMDSRGKLLLNNSKKRTIHDIRRYQAKVGSCMYGMIETRPDIAKSVGVVSQFNSNSDDKHEGAVDRIISYLNGTKDLGLLYRHQSGEENRDLDLHMFVDSDWAGDPNERKSTTGWTAMFAGAAISWASKKQTSIALSTMEAEYIAASEAAKEAVWLRNFINELNLPDKIVSVPLYIDNDAALRLSRNPEDHKRAKHIDLRHNYVRWVVTEGIVDTIRVDSKNNTADVLTKPLPEADFLRHVQGLGMTGSDCSDHQDA
ncbi:unnamed protein product [Zymoseptoria tritici ST99CH_1A5]|uniref:Integrase catalytic domain-containing protein n=1 Tax=Zymoseptoria tritici ST99CH_1A5 TaxID=1276529 RepID=A0A1Y6LXL1_ZYMTR|nr:unnamed protein product [Zymoseptoria tritici ST99CH_1A5]